MYSNARKAALLPLLALPLVALALAGCESAPLPEPTPAEQVPEAAFDSAALTEWFSPLAGRLYAPVLDAPLGANRVGALIMLDSADGPAPRIQVRGHDAAGEPDRWVEMRVSWREGEQVVMVADLPSVAHAAELRIDDDDAERVVLLQWSASIPEITEAAESVADVTATRSALSSELRALGVVSREQWGARATRCTSRDASKYRMAVHHTVTASRGDPAALVRGIQAYHMDGRGWCDVGYHFLVTLDGKVFEARPIDLMGAHVGSNNTGNIGVSFVGCFHTSSCSSASLQPNQPSNAMIEGGAAIIAGLSEIYGITRNATNVKGHRDHSGASTACPGDHLHARLGDLRSGAAAGPAYAASYVNQTFPLARQAFDLRPNETRSGYLEMRNDGSETWRPGQVFLGTTEPRDVASPIAGPDWVSASRAATIDREVPPGQTGRFNFAVQAPRTPGDYPQYFNLVREGVAWFSDSGQGGPADNVIQIRVTTTNSPPVEPDAGPAEIDAGPPADEPDAGGPMVARDAGDDLADAGVAPPSDGGPGGPGRMTVAGGCGCSAVPLGSTHQGMLIGLLAMGLVVARRRRRSAA